MSIDSSATGNKEKSFSTFRTVCYKKLSMLLSDHCFEINTHGIKKKKKKKKLSNTNYWLNRCSPAFAQDAFYEDYVEDLCASRRQN